MAQDHEFTVLRKDAVWTCATWQDLYILVWRGEATVDHAAANDRFLSSFSSRCPPKFSVVAVLEPSVVPPGPEARKHFAESQQKFADNISGTAYFMPITGFQGAMMRSVVTGLSLLARDPYPTRVFSDLRGATRWLNELRARGTPSSPEPIEAAIKQARLWG